MPASPAWSRGRTEQVLGSEESERRASWAAAFRERGRRRTRQDQISLGLSPVKLRTERIRTERRKLVSSAGPVFEKSELFGKYDPAV